MNVRCLDTNDFENTSFFNASVHWIANAIINKCEKIAQDIFSHLSSYAFDTQWTESLKNEVFSMYLPIQTAHFHPNVCVPYDMQELGT